MKSALQVVVCVQYSLIADHYHEMSSLISAVIGKVCIYKTEHSCWSLDQLKYIEKTRYHPRLLEDDSNPRYTGLGGRG